MANTIGLAQKYLPLLDEAYKVGSKFSILDADASLVRDTAQANTVLIPDVALQGLGAYSKSAGFVQGDVTFTWRSHTFTQDRGRTFSVDAMDNLETIDMAFAAVTGQFIRTKVTPEVDAYRAAMLASKAGNGITAGATLAADTAMQAIDTAFQELQDDEVNIDNCVIFITPEIEKYLKQSNLLVRQIDGSENGNTNRVPYTLDGKQLIVVPQTRMYTAITLYDGSTSGQEAGGYIKNGSTGKDLNFLIVDPNAAWGIKKTATPRIFDPMDNQAAHAWKFDYRLYHDLFVPGQKVNGIYKHFKA